MAQQPSRSDRAAPVRFVRAGFVAEVTLQRPDKFNAMSRAMWRELRGGFAELARQDDLRCIVVSGAAGHFCAGGDIAEYPQFRFEPQRLREFHEQDVWGALQAMLDCDVPMIAQIEGNCMGAGLEIASCCDIRIAGASARFGAPIARLGFPMAPRELDLVVRTAGVNVARQMLLEARVLDAPRMLQLGFLGQCVPDAELGAAVEQARRHIVALAPHAARMHKRMLRELTTPGGSAAPDTGDASRRAAAQDRLAGLLATAYDYADTPEHREGIGAFLAKRTPQF